jgi:hypothetical protein
MPVNPLLSGFRLGLAEAGHAITLFPLAAFLEQFHAFKPFENAAFSAQSGGGAKASML